MKGLEGAQWVTGWGEDDQGWNLEGNGMPGIGMVGSAIQVWACCNDRDCTVLEAALVFNISKTLVEQAVEAHPWMYVEHGIIQHEGE